MLLKNKCRCAGKLVLFLKISSLISMTQHLQYVAKGICVTHLLKSSDINDFQINKCIILSSALQCWMNQLVVLFLLIINFLIGDIFLLLTMWRYLSVQFAKDLIKKCFVWFLFCPLILSLVTCPVLFAMPGHNSQKSLYIHTSIAFITKKKWSAFQYQNWIFLCMLNKFFKEGCNAVFILSEYFFIHSQYILEFENVKYFCL